MNFLNESLSMCFFMAKVMACSRYVRCNLRFTGQSNFNVIGLGVQQTNHQWFALQTHCVEKLPAWLLLHTGCHVIRGAQTRHRRFLVVASLSGFMPTRTTTPPTGIGGGNHAKITTYHCTIFVISNSLGHNLSIGTMILSWQTSFNL